MSSISDENSRSSDNCSDTDSIKTKTTHSGAIHRKDILDHTELASASSTPQTNITITTNNKYKNTANDSFDIQVSVGDSSALRELHKGYTSSANKCPTNLEQLFHSSTSVRNPINHCSVSGRNKPYDRSRNPAKYNPRDNNRCGLCNLFAEESKNSVPFLKFKCDNKDIPKIPNTLENSQGYINSNIVKSEKINNTPIIIDGDGYEDITVGALITGDTVNETNNTPVESKNNNHGRGIGAVADGVFRMGTPSSRNIYSIASILGISDSDEKRVPASEAREEDSFHANSSRGKPHYCYHGPRYDHGPVSLFYPLRHRHYQLQPHQYHHRQPLRGQDGGPSTSPHPSRQSPAYLRQTSDFTPPMPFTLMSTGVSEVDVQTLATRNSNGDTTEKNSNNNNNNRMTNKNNVIKNVEVDDGDVSKGGDTLEGLASNSNNNNRKNKNTGENKNKDDDNYDYDDDEDDDDDNNNDDYCRTEEVESPEKVENDRNIPINIIPGKIYIYVYILNTYFRLVFLMTLKVIKEKKRFSVMTPVGTVQESHLCWFL